MYSSRDTTAFVGPFIEYKQAMSLIWMSHVTHMNEPCHMHEWATWHIWMPPVTHTEKSRHTHAHTSIFWVCPLRGGADVQPTDISTRLDKFRNIQPAISCAVQTDSITHFGWILPPPDMSTRPAKFLKSKLHTVKNDYCWLLRNFARRVETTVDNGTRLAIFL